MLSNLGLKKTAAYQPFVRRELLSWLPTGTLTHQNFASLLPNCQAYAGAERRFTKVA